MNTFKTVVMVCAMLAASCSGQYMSQSSGNKGSSGLNGMLGGQYANQGQQSVLTTGTLPLEQQRPAFSPSFEQQRPAAAPAMSAPTVSAPATTQQICSCITINPAASAASSVQGSTGSVAAAAQQTFSAPQQTFAATSQQTFAATSQQTFAAAQQTSAAAQQQAYAAPQPTPAQTKGRY